MGFGAINFFARVLVFNGHWADHKNLLFSDPADPGVLFHHNRHILCLIPGHVQECMHIHPGG